MLRSERFFQAVALPYDLVTRHPVWERDCARMASELPPRCRLALDLGCGPGNSAAHRRDRRLLLVRGDARGLPLRDGSLDAVTFHSVLYLLPDRAAALRETARVLRPGGRAVLLEPRDGVRAAGKALLRALPRPRWAMTALLWRTMSGFYGSFSAGQLRLLLEEAGLRVLKLDEALDGLGLLAVAERPG